MIIAPKIHINGTSQAELIRQISEANHALSLAIEALAAMSPNARDYYHTENFTAARKEHDARINAVIKVQNEIMEIGENIADQ